MLQSYAHSLQQPWVFLKVNLTSYLINVSPAGIFSDILCATANHRIVLQTYPLKSTVVLRITAYDQ